MRLTVQLFAVARQRAGRAEIVFDLPEPATVVDLKRALAEDCPALVSLLPNLRFAVDAEFALDDRTAIPPGAEVAVIPPVSGGSPGRRPHDPRSAR